MQALSYFAFGAADDGFILCDMPPVAPKASEVLVRLACSEANPSDVKSHKGARPGITKAVFNVSVPRSDAEDVITVVEASPRTGAILVDVAT